MAANITVPSGGNVPAAALLANGGPLDGVELGAPWDVPFLNHYRQLCVRNDHVGTGLRSIFVDGYLVSTTPSSGTVTPSGSSITLGAAMPGNVAECLVWNNVALTQTQIDDLVRAQRVKWEVPTLMAPIAVAAVPTAVVATQSTNIPSTTVLVQISNLTAVGDLPADLPPPRCWLDAAHPSSLFADTTSSVGTVYAHRRVPCWKDKASCACPNGRVRLWRDHRIF